MTTNTESSVKIGPIVANIFGGICQFLLSFCPVFCKNSTNSLLKLRIYRTDLHHVFTQCSGIRAAPHASCYNTILRFVSEMSEHRVKAVNFYVCKKPKNKLVIIAVLGLPAKLVSFVIPIHISTKAKMLVKFGSIFAYIFGKICRLLPSRPKSYGNSLCI